MIRVRKTARRNLSRDDSAPLYQNRLLNKIAARWDARAASWERSLRQPRCHLNEDEAYARFLHEVHRELDQRRSFCASGGVIDVGCGTGLVLADVISRFAWGIGVDISHKMIALARQKPIPNARFLIADAFHLPSHCPPAAAVLSRGVLLSHYGHGQSEELLNAFRMSLLPRGFVILDFLNLAARSRHRHATDAKTYFADNGVSQMAQNAGFNSVKILGRIERRVLVLIAELNV